MKYVLRARDYDPREQKKTVENISEKPTIYRPYTDLFIVCHGNADNDKPGLYNIYIKNVYSVFSSIPLYIIFTG